MKADSHEQTPAWLMKGMVIIGVFFIVAAVIGIIFINNSPGGQANQSGGPLRAGMKMVDFTLPNLQGERVSLKNYSGQMVLINAWATWCPPCKEEMPALNTLYVKNRDSGFVLLAVNAGETKAQAGAFADELGLKFPILLDETEQLMDRLGIRDYPTSILVGKDGVIQWVHVGLLTSDAIERDLQPLLQQ